MSADKTHTKKIIESCCCWWIRIVGPFLRFLLSIFGPQNGQARANDASIIFHTVMQGKKWAIVDDVALKPSFILCNNNNVRCCGMCNKSIGADFGREYDVDPDECARRCRIVGYRISCPPLFATAEKHKTARKLSVLSGIRFDWIFVGQSRDDCIWGKHNCVSMRNDCCQFLGVRSTMEAGLMSVIQTNTSLFFICLLFRLQCAPTRYDLILWRDTQQHTNTYHNYTRAVDTRIKLVIHRISLNGRASAAHSRRCHGFWCWCCAIACNGRFDVWTIECAGWRWSSAVSECVMHAETIKQRIARDIVYIWNWNANPCDRKLRIKSVRKFTIQLSLSIAAISFSETKQRNIWHVVWGTWREFPDAGSSA